MCLVAILAVLVYVVIATFFITARILLPWTIASTILAGLSALGFVVAMRPRLGKACVALSFPLNIVLTVVYGYFACLLVEPQPPPQQAPSQDVVEVLFTWPKPNVSKKDLWNMLPVHLCISGVLGGVIVASLATGGLLLKKEDAAEGESPFQKEIRPSNLDLE
jgi:hypothetical protein